MWEVWLKRSGFFLTICCVLLLSLIVFTSPFLKLLGQTSHLAVVGGVLTLLLGLFGYTIFHWCPQIWLLISSKRVCMFPPQSLLLPADETAADTSPPITNYEVFISFRGEDTRDNFTSHLYDALCRKRIKTFIDDRLNRGEEISSTLLKTIERSEIFVIIFSKNYASSTWCLDELEKILECKERYGRLVIPIFYNVNPSNVRRQTAGYADSFVKHTKRFNNDMGKVYRWKDALAQASNLSGLDSTKIRPEPKLIRKIVKDILRKLKRNSSYDFKGLVGIHDHISAVESFLNIESQDVRIVGIVGMGGIGKTTIADAVFHKLQPQFESCCFVLSVQEQLRTTGLGHIRNKYLQELLDEEEDIGIHSCRSLFVKKILQRKKILLVLDDINKSMQFEDLIRRRNWFGPGSRIIITTRDMQVLRTANADEIYHVKEMSFDNSFQLFSTKAFKQGLPIKDYLEVSKEAVNYCKGVPLALKVLGSFLYGRTKQDWENALKRLQKAPQKEILDVLKLSFDGLDDDLKDIFLDIAVFYDGKVTRSVKELLNSYSFSADFGINILIDRSLISVWGDNAMMHDLIRAMGREIVCQPTVYKSATGRRLWKHEDIYHVLKNKKETDEIHGMCLDVSAIKEIYLRSDVFEKMENLKILKFYKPRWNCSSRLHIPNGLENLPEELRFFKWDEYPHRFMPLNSCANNIVELNLYFSKVEQLWVGDQHLPNLKSIDLRGSNHLIGIPDLSMAPKIRLINLSYCKNLSQVYSSRSLHNLQGLCLLDCDALKTVNVGGNKVDQRSWRLQADYEFFILYGPFLHKVCMRIFKSDSSNSYTFHFNSVSVPVASMSESVDNDSAVLTLLHGALTSVLPNLEVLRLFDNPSSLGSLSKLLRLTLRVTHFSGEDFRNYVKLETCPELVEPTESLCSRGMKGTGNKGVVLSWDREDLIDTDDQNLTEHSIYICDCRLSKIHSNNWRWECLTQVSLHRSDILTLPASVHDSTSLNSLLLYDYTWTQFTEFTFSLDSETPDDVSKISFSLAEQRSLDHTLLIRFCGNDGRYKDLSFGNDNYISNAQFISLHLYL